jgi:hypothetical protein
MMGGSIFGVISAHCCCHSGTAPRYQVPAVVASLCTAAKTVRVVACAVITDTTHTHYPGHLRQLVTECRMEDVDTARRVG